MTRLKRCPKCLESYPENHWAHNREDCPTCGGKLELTPVKEIDQDTSRKSESRTHEPVSTGSSKSATKKEIAVTGLIGFLLIVSAVCCHVFYALMAGDSGQGRVPVWLNILAGIMILVGCLTLVWAITNYFKQKK